MESPLPLSVKTTMLNNKDTIHMLRGSLDGKSSRKKAHQNSTFKMRKMNVEMRVRQHLVSVCLAVAQTKRARLRNSKVSPAFHSPGRRTDFHLSRHRLHSESLRLILPIQSFLFQCSL